ncbi:MAG: leucine-rich repeat domain-containing protein [Lachnospiraceae bacterium]|nr:leucine-rich repeat domain-containing protein [Lachnospiraceae bacterium]
MGEYVDKTYIVIDGVILFYEDNKESVSVRVPEKMGDMDIHIIGDGAFRESGTIQYINLPYGIKKIGQNAFKGCKNLKCLDIPSTAEDFGNDAFTECPELKHIRIYNYEVSEQKYQEMKAIWRCANKTVYIAGELIDDKRLKNAVRAASVGPANMIQDGIARLFMPEKPDHQKTTSTSAKQSCFGFDKRSHYISESESIKDLLVNPDFAEADALSEEKNDQFLKNENIPEIKKTAILTFDDTKTNHENGRYYLLLDIVIGYHFWQSLVPVNFEGKLYYIYRRHFLSSQMNLNYIRNDVKVVSSNGENVAMEEAGKVYAKYKLLSIL